jgi:hypothetical protein
MLSRLMIPVAASIPNQSRETEISGFF